VEAKNVGLEGLKEWIQERIAREKHPGVDWTEDELGLMREILDQCDVKTTEELSKWLQERMARAEEELCIIRRILRILGNQTGVSVN